MSIMKPLLQIAIFLSVLFNVSTCLAEKKLSPFSAILKQTINLSELLSKHKKPNRGSNLVETINPIKLNTQIFGVGNVAVTLDRKWLPSQYKFFDSGAGLVEDKSDPIFLRGTIRLRLAENRRGKKRLRQVPVAATVYDSNSNNSKFKIIFTGTAPSNRYLAIESDIKNGASGKTVRVRNISGRALSGKMCADNKGIKYINALSKITNRDVNTRASYKTIQISTEGDFQWYQDFGNSSNTEIASILNTVETIYESQLNLTFQIVRQVTITSNSRYNSNDSEVLLEEFRTFTLNNSHLGSADVYHLFTGKDVFGYDENNNIQQAVIGLAYSIELNNVVYGVICLEPDYAFGLTENFSPSLNYLTTAHEIGHNFGATHDVAGSIMGTTLNANNPPTEFSSTSKGQINNHVNNYGSCLAVSTPTPAATAVGTSNPSATAVPTSSSGGGNGTSPEMTPFTPSPVRLNTTLSKDGTVKVKISLDTLSDTCTMVLRAGNNMNNINVAGILTTLDSTSSSREFSFIIPQKLDQFDKKGKKIKIYFKVIQTCEDGTVNYSELKNIMPYKVKINKKAVSVKAWIKLLKDAFLLSA